MIPLTPPSDMPTEPEGTAAMRRLGIYVEWRKWAFERAAECYEGQSLEDVLSNADTIVAWMFKEYEPPK